MVALREHSPQFTPAEYLEWEEQQEFRHEYVDGEVCAMTGGTLNHSEIAENFTSILKNHLQGSGFRVLNSDAKVQILESNSYLYPDLSVTCDDLDRRATKFISYPCLIVEVLSPTTEAYDRGDKFALYRRSTTLQDYVLVSTNAMRVDLYQRNDSLSETRSERGRWEILSYDAGDSIELPSVNLSVPVEQVYEDIIFGLEPELPV
jgi:Uma2 family endonuclease